MPTGNAWFNEEWFAQEKIKQMQVLGQEIPAGDTPVAQLQAAIDAYNAAHAQDAGFVAVTIESNFTACNTAAYLSSVPMSAVNVSPNPLFDVPTYLTSLAVKANASGYTAPGYTAGEWTAETVLQHMFEDGHMSAWEHFKAAGMDQMVNPSNTFNTEAYLAARAEAMGNGATVEDAISAIKALGLNPIEDYYGFGQENGITLTQVEPAIIPGMQDGGQWGTVVPPSEDDPYDNIQATQEATKGEDHLTGETGVNTEFVTNYGNMRADQTLGADDTFAGGANAYNTLQVTLGSDWAGFNGVKTTNEETGETTTAANVTGVGRILLDHITTNTERTYSFSGKNIEGAERIDIVNHGGGTITLEDLSQSVQEVRLSGLSNAAATTIAYADGEVSGSNDPLLLVINGVGENGKAASVAAEGIEELTVRAEAGSENFVNLAGFKNAESLVITGAGDIEIAAPAKGITTYDASAATGVVNMSVGKIDGNTVIKGGSNVDTLTLTTGSNRFAANWTGIETLALEKGTSCNIDMTNSDGALSQLWVGTEAGNATLTGVKATNFTINQASTNAQVTVNGDIENLFWSDQNSKAPVTAKVASDVTGNATINVAADQIVNGKFTLNDAKGTVTVNVAEANDDDSDSTAGTIAGTTINAEAAESFVANINGALGTGNTFNVVGGKANDGRSVTISAADVKIGKTTLKADGATDVTLDLTANPSAASQSVTFDGSLQGAQTVAITLANSNTGGPNDAPSQNYAFELNPDLSSANEVTVTGDGYESAKLGNLGADNSNEALQLTATDLAGFTVGDMLTGQGWNIDVTIETVSGNVALGEIKAGTDDAGNGQGDVNVTVSTTTTTGDGNLADADGNDIAISGDALAIDFSGVAGTIATGKVVKLSAQAGIDYTGNDNAESLQITSVGSDDSVFALGGGADKINFASTKLGTSSTVEVTVDLTEDAAAIDEIAIGGFVEGNKLLITVDGFDLTAGSADKVTGAYTTALTDDNLALVAKALADFGIASNVAVGDDGFEAATNADGGFVFEGNLYAINAGAFDAAGISTIVCIGSADEFDAAGVITAA